MSKKKHILYLGSLGFPYGLAEVQKMILISQGLIEDGNAVTVICRRGIHRKQDHPEMKASGNYQGIEYAYASKTPFRSENFFVRNALKIKGLVNEFMLLKKLRKNKELDYAILSTHNFYSILYYFFISKLFGFKTALNYVEYYSGVPKKWHEISRWSNNKLYDDYGPKLVDAVFPISEFLIAHLKEVAPRKRYLKIPVLTNFERYNDAEMQQGGKYFLFCGAANYSEIIKFIIDSFCQLETNGVFLYLVVNGFDKDVAEVKDYINHTNQKDRIKLFSRLTEKQLNNYYKNAMALLIPLRPAFQDKARFPHKIGEYLASGNPVISTYYGEVAYYFTNMENMLIADKYETKLFTQKMQFVLDHPEEARKIGQNGKQMALKNFDYKIYGKKIIDFLDQIPNGKKSAE